MVQNYKTLLITLPIKSYIVNYHKTANSGQKNYIFYVLKISTGITSQRVGFSLAVVGKIICIGSITSIYNSTETVKKNFIINFDLKQI